VIPLPIVFAAVAAIAGFTGAWTYQEARYGKQIADIHSTHAMAFAAAQKEAHDTTLKLQASKDEALRLAAKRQSALANDLAGARNALVGLHGASDSALRSASDSHGACLATATAQRDVLDFCSTRLVEVGAAADAHASDVQTLIDSWPKKD
jgi:hypothetical protein